MPIHYDYQLKVPRWHSAVTLLRSICLNTYVTSQACKNIPELTLDQVQPLEATAVVMEHVSSLKVVYHLAVLPLSSIGGHIV